MSDITIRETEDHIKDLLESRINLTEAIENAQKALDVVNKALKEEGVE